MGMDFLTSIVTLNLRQKDKLSIYKIKKKWQ